MDIRDIECRLEEAEADWEEALTNGTPTEEVNRLSQVKGYWRLTYQILVK